MLSVDFLPDCAPSAVAAAIRGKAERYPQMRGEDLLRGIVNSAVGKCLAKYSANAPFSQDRGLADRLAACVKDFRLPVVGSLGFDYAQVTKGGVPLGEVDDDLMSRRAEGLYLLGELLDVDGECGGYNLQWRFPAGRSRRLPSRGGNMRIDDLRLRPGESEEKLVRLAAKKLRGCSYIRILKKSLDARDKSDIRWVYSVEADRRPIVPSARAYPAVSRRPARVIVAGSGPAGLFCAVRLLRSGIRPLVVERGGTVEERAAQNERFFREHILDEDCNVQFGEGGAGTFSDGKLNTQTRDARNREVLDTFVEFGAPPEVAYLNKPHVGSDRLRAVVRNMRRFILENGGEVRFHCRLEDVVVQGGALRGVVLRDLSTGREERADASELVLAIGHSARDTFRMLLERGFSMQAREFAVGVRIEHLQANIDLAQYGRARGPLPVADYKLVSHAGERTAFTFCMCPGGYVMPAASEAGGVVTNGMSNYAYTYIY